MAGVSFDRASRIYPRSDRPAVDQLDLEPCLDRKPKQLSGGQ
jgi:ABC-type sugar transport system ATPase subunit